MLLFIEQTVAQTQFQQIDDNMRNEGNMKMYEMFFTIKLLHEFMTSSLQTTIETPKDQTKGCSLHLSTKDHVLTL